jgi:hypothetical protein
MVDPEGRRQVAELLRHYLAGLMTNDELEDRLPRHSKDAAVSEVAWASWFLYDDIRMPYKLVGKDAASKAVRRTVARWLVFLGTDLEYEYFVPSKALSLAFIMANLCTLGLLGWVWRRRCGEQRAYWPFLRKTDYDLAISSPKLLASRA